MSKIKSIFERINNLTHEEGQNEFAALLIRKSEENRMETGRTNVDYDLLKTFLQKIFKEIDDLAVEIKQDNTILISVRHQKLLRTCLQLIVSLGVSLCLIPGLGISLSKRCLLSPILPNILLSDEQKYEILVACTDFFTRCYKVPVLKSIIITFHMSDYLAALIQLSFAPLKKPGTYNNFIMTPEMFDKLNIERQKYVQIYEHLVTNCFQPILMKELLVLQSVVDPPPPMFVKRVIAKELSRRLLASGGLLSLIRCFVESHSVDTGHEWTKVDLICKIVTAKHGNISEVTYLQNICLQLAQILTLNDTHYLTTAIACLISLNEAYPHSDTVKFLVKEVFNAFDIEHLISKCNLPGTVILSPQEIEHKVNILHACCTTTHAPPNNLITPNLSILFLLGVKCSKNKYLKIKLQEMLLKCLGLLKKMEVLALMKKFLFGDTTLLNVAVEEYEAGLTIKCVSEHSISDADATLYLIILIKHSVDKEFVEKCFEAFLSILSELWSERRYKGNIETLLSEDDDIAINIEEQYGHVLKVLSELATLPSVITALKRNPSIVLNFIEFVLNNETYPDDDCTTIALVYLNTTLIPYSDKNRDLEERLSNLVPTLKDKCEDNSFLNSDLCREALSLISSKKPKDCDTAYGKAVSDVFDALLPVRAHGIMELTKLINAKDPETISKKHYLFCLFQSLLKDTDSYIYLSAINGLASLGAHCTEDVLQVLCEEFLQTSLETQNIETKEEQDKIAETRMKTGDIIVKITKRLGEMAIVHKTILLNTMLTGCRDSDPLIRTSALSNLAEIVLVLHYKVGTILYEILQCVWDVLETDKALECRRAAVMVISSLLKGLGQETLQSNKDYLLPIYRTLKKLNRDDSEDSIVRLHAQIALEELDAIVKEFLFPEVNLGKQIFVLDKPEDKFK